MSTFTPGNIYWPFIFKRWSWYLAGIVSVAATNFFQLAIPYFTGKIIDILTLKKEQALFYEMLVGLILSVLLLTLMRVGWRLFLARQTHFAAHQFRDYLFKNLRFFSLEDFLKKYSVGDVLNLATSDSDQARFVFGFTLVGLFDMLGLGLFCFIMISMVDIEVMYWSLLFLLIHPAACWWVANKEMANYHESQNHLSDLNELATQTVHSVKLQRLSNGGERWSQLLDAMADKYRQKRLRTSQFGLLYSPVIGSMEFFIFLIIFAVTIPKVMSGEISVGEFVALQSYVLLLQGPIVELGFVVSDVQRSRGSMQRLVESYNNPKDTLFRGENKLNVKAIDITVKNLSFAYEDNKTVFEGVSFTLASGSSLGIDGPIGSGKSTLLELVAGIRPFQKGEIYFNQTNINEIDRVEIARLISVVPTQAFLFSESIRYNLQLDGDYSDDDLWRILDLVELTYDFQKFKEGLDTVVGENGVSLSGGQRQRLCIARALIRRPSIILLDDALSAVDIHTEEKIINNLKTFLQGTSVVYATHRTDSLAFCDKLIALEKAES